MTTTSRTANAARAGKTDGRIFPVTKEDVRKGAVLRMVHRSDGSVAAFSDFVVVDVFQVDSRGARIAGFRVRQASDGAPAGWVVKMARPYAYATEVGSVLTGVETLEVPEEKLLGEDSLFSAVVQSTGLVATNLT